MYTVATIAKLNMVTPTSIDQTVDRAANIINPTITLGDAAIIRDPCDPTIDSAPTTSKTTNARPPNIAPSQGLPGQRAAKA
ncbi:hypothetical protein FGO68_gene1352 [Halteria grandinella]|uniref:Uncharacterized protein n=1 Tax=Halteria grandinella TaxID=5974 RepID=A0A8J8NAH8_HALGN|nr:hypothetical protein FGO68_gene1352 [Halteria grandinella]